MRVETVQRLEQRSGSSWALVAAGLLPESYAQMAVMVEGKADARVLGITRTHMSS